jgi:circadian clock protein KaiB
MALKKKSPAQSASPAAEWQLRLYVAGLTPRSRNALANLQALCEQRLKGRYDLEIIDLLLNPRRASEDQILAVPTLLRKMPEPIRRLIGNLADMDRVLEGLELAQWPG